jgi:hypothetical protein
MKARKLCMSSTVHVGTDALVRPAERSSATFCRKQKAELRSAGRTRATGPVLGRTELLDSVAGSGQLETKLRSQLNQPRIVGLDHLSEIAGVDVTNRVEELGMIEDLVSIKS